MAEYGIQISQEGVPLKRAADYQKVLDDKWPFIDILFEGEFKISKADWPAANTWWVYEIAQHNLGYLPGFTYREIGTSLITGNTQIIATTNKIYLRGLWLTGDPTTPLNINIYLRVFALDITKEYEYKGERPESKVRMSARKYGAKVIDPRSPTASLSNQEMSDFSLNTNAKALAIHKTGVQDINPWSRYGSASVSSIDTANNILTFSGTNIPWTQTVGQACAYFPSDFVTYPSPLSTSTYYIIPLTTTTLKLASTYQNALDGVAIDITTTGSLPGQLQAMENPSNPTDVITHNIGYPPTYLFAIYDPDGPGGIYTDPLMGAPVITSLGSLNCFITATTTTIKLTGAQSVFSGRVAYVIIRDPSEIAG
jgi:hypothetical protein